MAQDNDSRFYARVFGLSAAALLAMALLSIPWWWPSCSPS